MDDLARHTLREAATRNVPCLLVLPGAALEEAHRSRLLAAADDDGVWIESPPRLAILLAAVQSSAEPVAVSFRAGEHVVRFVTPVVGRDPAFRLSDAVTVDALRLARPPEVLLALRRRAFRVRPVPDSGLRVRAWQIDDQTSPLSVPTTPAIATDLRDLSVGGLGVVLRPATKPNPPVRQGDRLRIELTAGGRTLTAAARVRQTPRRLPDGSLRLGLDFEELDHTIEGRRTQTQLAHLVAELERVEARRRAG